MKKHANLVGLLAAWIVVFAIFSYFAPNSFPTVRNLETIARQTAIVGFAAVGMTYVIVAGGIDLSVGSMVALVAVVVAWCLRAGYPPEVAAVAGIAAGGLCGFINGWLTGKLKITPFIVTLGSLTLLRGLSKGIADEKKIDAPLTWLNQLLAALGPHQRWMLVPVGVWMLVAVSVLAAWALRYTAFGRHTVAIGSNLQTARLCGVPVDRVRTSVFVVGGLCAGLAGLMQFSRLSVGDPTVAVGLELQVIAAVVIGGGSLSGGEGSILGSLIGAVIMTTISAGGSHMGLPNWVQEIVTGLIIVAAVALNRWRAAASLGETGSA